ncbi:LysM peptidoglycan-binding domain-containing protein [Marininema mesophilum]
MLAERFNTTYDAIMQVNPGVNLYNLFVGQIINIPLSRQQMTVSGNHPTSYYPYSYHHPCITKAEVDLRNLLRKLWVQHVEWTRMTIISMVDNLKDVDLVTKRLLRNPSDLGTVFNAYYGSAIYHKFVDLFTEHLVIAAQLVKAAKAGDTKTAESEEKRWYANADEIAIFLNSINPYWPKEDLRHMLYTHLRLTKSEAVFRLRKDYTSDIANYETIEEQALEMADAFADGIVKQFPSMFSSY